MNTVKVKYCIEDLKYRVFGLFPFFADNGNDEIVLYKGNSAKDGCYGQLTCALRIPCDLIINGELVLSRNNVYQYRTLKYYYNKYKMFKNVPFIEFMDEGIGRVKVNANINFEECDLVQDYINLSECNDLYDEMTKMKIQCDAYIARKNADGIINCDMECMLTKYHRMGGDVMLAFYKKSSIDADNIATKFFTQYAEPEYSDYKVNLFIGENIHDMGSVTNYVDMWYEHNTYYHGDIIVYDGESYVCKGKYERVEEDGKQVYKDVGVLAEWDDTEGVYIFDLNYYETIKDTLTQDERDLYVYNNDIVLTGDTDSKLKSFRKYSDYLNTAGYAETPGIDEDWLFYYKINHVSGYTANRDEIGNIAVFDGCSRADVGSVDNNLMLYGDILTNIEYDTTNYKITFTYVIGAHLTAVLVGIDTNELGDVIFKYDNLKYDINDEYHGVKHQESYYYQPLGEIDELIRTNKFMDFVTNDVLSGHEFTKAAFNTYSSINTSVADLDGVLLEYNYLPSKFTSKVKADRETSIYPLIRPDYYDSISYTPDITNRVSFSRGNAAAFESHLKLGEVKSFDDLLNYMNGEYFNIQ